MALKQILSFHTEVKDICSLLKAVNTKAAFRLRLIVISLALKTSTVEERSEMLMFSKEFTLENVRAID